LFCGTTDYGVIKSTDNGVSWASAGNGGLTNVNISSLLVNGTVLLAGTNGSGVFRSTNNGANFTSVSTSLPANSQVKKLSLYGTTVFAALRYSGVYKTTDNGNNWIPANIGFPPSTMNINTVISSGNLLFAGGTGLYVSSNGGNQWVLDTAGLPLNTYFQTLFAIGNSVYTGSNGSGIYKQTYNGTTLSSWTSFSVGFYPRTDVRDIIYKSPNLYAGIWGQGVWRTPITGIENISSVTPDKFSLHQNYPNPFNPVTNISFDISKSGNVKLIIYDISGKEIAVLLNDILTPGSYKINWDASGLSSGVYFYKLQSGDFSEIKKMTLIK
jgi:hypothetical protein